MWDDYQDEEPLAVLREPLPAGMLEEVALGPLVELSRSSWDDEEDDVAGCVHQCPVCGTDFFDRRNKLYCCHRCQKKAYKLRRKGLLDPVFFPGQHKAEPGYRKARYRKMNAKKVRDVIRSYQHADVWTPPPPKLPRKKKKRRSWKDNWLWLW